MFEIFNSSNVLEVGTVPYYNLVFDRIKIATCDTLKNCFTIKLWTDIFLRINENSTFSYNAADGTKIDCHDKPQYGYDFYFNYINIKLISPWFLKTKKPMDFIWTKPIEGGNNEFITMSGIREFYTSHVSHINLLFPVKNKPYEIFLKVGTPLLTLIPLNQKVKLKYKFCKTSEEFYDYFPELPRIYAERNYLKLLRNTKNEKK